MEVSIKVIKIVVYPSNSGDQIDLYLDLPDRYPSKTPGPFKPKNVTTTLYLERETGVQYVRDNFGVEPEIVYL